MKISFPECEQIVKTLSVGYYAKRRIPISMDKDAECSYYSPMDDCIGISYKQISVGLKTMPETEDKESAVRASFYHEVSHAILTPKDLTCTDINNIFEDERIETLLKDFYLDVDFKKNILAINGGMIQTPDSAITAFYNTVRYRMGKPEYVARVAKLIDNYENLNRNSHDTWSYEWDIRQLYDDIAKDWKSNPDDYMPRKGKGKGSGSAGDSDDGAQDGSESGEEQDGSAQ